MTLKDVHKLIPEISISRLSNWEQGINMVSVDEAKKLANALKVPAAYLLTLDDSPMSDVERVLLEQFRSADMRGRKYILRAAQGETGEPVISGKPSHQIIDATLPDPTEFSSFAEQRRHERRMAQTKIDIDRRSKNRREQ